MKKIVFGIVILLLIPIISWSFLDFYRSMFIRFDTVKDLAKWTNDDPERLSWWIMNNIYYKEDEGKADNWTHPELVMTLKKGDCEEFASLPYRVMDYWTTPINKYIVSFNGETSHAVLIYKWNSKWHIMSNGMIKKCYGRSLFECIDDYIKANGYEGFKFKNIDGNEFHWKDSRDALGNNYD